MLRAAINWLIRPSKPATPPAQAPDAATVADLGARLYKLEQTFGELVDLRLQWTEVLDKLQRWTNRQNARDAARVQRELQTMAETSEDAPGTPISPQVGGNQGDIKLALRRRLRAQNGGTP